MGRILVHSIMDYDRGFVTLNERGNEADGIVLYRMMDDKHCGIYYVETDRSHEQDQDKMIRLAFKDIINADRVPVPTCQQALDWYEKERMRKESEKQKQEETGYAMR